MTTILIREITNAGDGPNATLSIDGQGEYPVTVRDPFDPEEERLLEWYFEQWLRFPFTDYVLAATTARSIQTYGTHLFDQIFADRNAFAHYSQVRQANLGDIRIEVAGSPAFHALHWEALYDPTLQKHLALEATMVRRTNAPPALRAEARPGPTINLLLVTARPGGARDVGYRTIARPLVELLHQSKLPVQIDLVRPGSYQALVHHLNDTRDRHGPGYYHIIHFDLHGGLLRYDEFDRFDQAARDLSAHTFIGTRYGRGALEPYAGQKAFLFFEGATEGKPDPAEASEVAALLQTHQIPIGILNACQSGKQVGASETSLGARLMQAGVRLVLAMGYSVTVSAAERAMQTLYSQLFAGADVAQAVRRARSELHADKRRRAYFSQVIELEDWLLPVVYQNAPVRLHPTPMRSEEHAAFYERQGRRYEVAAPTYGFIGRDLDILAIERRLLGTKNILLMRGMGGAGKTTLLRHLGAWWQTTGLVDQVFAFAYDQRAWTRQQILDAIAQKLLTSKEYTDFQPMSPADQQALITARLRSTRHLLILDNLESITGAELAIRHTLPEDEQAALRSLLGALADGQTLVLLGSRAAEEWLSPGTFGDNRYELPGLDAEAASDLAEAIIKRQGGAQYRGTAELTRLIGLLGGFPLALEVVLPNLAHQPPVEILEALQAGDAVIDPNADAQDKTRSILRCIDYSFSNLDPEAQTLLTCLAPFVGVIFTNTLGRYIAELKQQPTLAGLPLDRLPEVVQAAVAWGLLAPHPQAQGFLRIQPTLPYFLRHRLAEAAQQDVSEAIALAFVALYQQRGAEMNQLLMAKEPQQRLVGATLASLEYENLLAALETALSHQLSLTGIYVALDEFWDITQEHQRGITVGERARQALARYPAERLQGEDGFFLMRVTGDLGRRYMDTKQFAQAEQAYQAALQSTLSGSPASEPQRKRWRATPYHHLGIVAQAQRQWAQAEGFYQQALAIFIEFNDRYAQASTYHQLGRVAEEQRQWAQAERFYQQALALKIEFNDRYAQAGTYHQLGRVAEEQRQWAQAERFYQQALALFIEFNDRYAQARTYHQLGIVAQEQRQWAEAERFYQQALALFIEFNDRYAQASTYHQLGIVAQAQRQWTQAERFYQQALALKIEFNDRYAQASTYHQLGRFAEAQRQWAQAERFYQQALAIYVEFNDRSGQASTYHHLGMVAQAQRQWVQAEGCYQQALAIYVEFNDRYAQAGIYGQLGLLAEAQGQLAQAQQHLLQALAIFGEYSDQHSLGIALRSLARLRAAGGDATLAAAVAQVLGVSVAEAEQQLQAAAPTDEPDQQGGTEPNV
ncbi:tetratricopeptide repeat protein [Candidatus Chloroploca sp. Khr17]|uniref:tetratricopeptide repeat protein n=1 Tax=Candidatus Chloroploca sp. Khr17 TaxID=2496869 RepID=UPI00101D08ED|nr:tetratricopeptide repeat protein [Candidatus Chloroploca sp. Khr17]